MSPCCDAAAEHLTRQGYEVIDAVQIKNTVVAWDRNTDEIVFAKVRRHAKLLFRNRLRREAKAKRLEFRRACNVWRRVNKWHGSWRIDVINLYGDGDNRPFVDHIMSVKEYNNDKK